MPDYSTCSAIETNMLLTDGGRCGASMLGNKNFVRFERDGEEQFQVDAKMLFLHNFQLGNLLSGSEPPNLHTPFCLESACNVLPSTLQMVAQPSPSIRREPKGRLRKRCERPVHPSF